MLYKIRGLWEYVHTEGMKDAFTDELDTCVALTFKANSESVGGEKQTVWELKDSCTGLDGHELVVRDVKACLERAYKAYHAGNSRRLSYEKYERFMEVCRGWGSLMRDRQMMSWYQETEKEYTTRGSRQAAEQAGGAAEPTNEGTKTGGAERMQELLAALRKLLDTYEKL